MLMSISKGDPAPAFEAENQRGKKLKVPGERKAVLIFMRYLGCPLCLAKMDEVQATMDEFSRAGAEVMVVMQSTKKRVKDFAEKRDLNFLLLPDPDKRLYQLYEASPGGLGAYLTANVLIKSVSAILRGKMHGAFEGNEFQVPAAFVIGADGRVHYAHYGKDVADFGDINALINAVEKAL
jgi:peroxiredoxin Q/BCP